MSSQTPRRGRRDGRDGHQGRDGEGSGGGSSMLGRVAAFLLIIIIISITYSQRLLINRETIEYEVKSSAQLRGKDQTVDKAVETTKEIVMKSSLSPPPVKDLPKDFSHVWKHGKAPVIHTPPAPDGNNHLVPPAEADLKDMQKRMEIEKAEMRRKKEEKKKRDATMKKAKDEQKRKDQVAKFSINTRDKASAETLEQLKQKPAKHVDLSHHTKGDHSTAEPLPYDYHPRVSPRKGSDISTPAAQADLLNCPNQSKCIVPELLLETKLRVYLCRHPVRQGVRFYFLTREGLLLHPGVTLVPQTEMLSADFAVYLPGSAPWHRTECNDTRLADKLIVMDEFDGHQAFSPAAKYSTLFQMYPASQARVQGQWYFQMFKRSYVVRKRGYFKYYPHLTKPDFYPITYSLAEAYLRGPFTHTRKWDIVCTLRGSRQQPARLRVQEWLKEYAEDRKIPANRVVTGQINKASRTSVNTHYFELMHSARIIVTVNPSDWEGDFRLWEAMASGALVFVDPVFAPHAFPLEHEKHVVFFSNANKTDMWQKLDYYRLPENHAEARRIAVAGYLHCMKYHRTVNMMDYVLRTAHAKKAVLEKQTILPSYPYTGQYMVYQTTLDQKQIEKVKEPTLYKPLPFTAQFAPKPMPMPR